MQQDLSDLNERQHQAVTYEQGSLLVLAGAGSGKTRVLIARICHLIDSQGFAAWQILALTFSNKAAKEMKERLQASLEQERSKRVTIGTFHSFCLLLLRRFAHAHSFGSDFSVIDVSDQLRILHEIYRQRLANHQEEVDAKSIRQKASAVLSFIVKQKEQGIRAASVPMTDKLEWRELYQQYENYCLENRLVDFTEMLLLSTEMLETQTEVAASLQSRFAHILIDEFQDTNDLQFRLLSCLRSADNKFFAVGDDDQAIYEWRGAKPENLQNFVDKFQVNQVVALERNYRSSSQILAVANHLIAHNQRRMPKQLVTDSQGQKVKLLACSSDYGETRTVLQNIRAIQQNENIELNQFAVLYRTNDQSRLFEKACIEAGIDYQISGGLKFFLRQEVKHALAYLHLVLSDNEFAAKRVINMPPRKIGGKSLEKLLAGAGLFSNMRNSTNSNVCNFIEMIAKLRTKPLDDLEQLINEVYQESGLLKYYEDKQETERAENLHQLRAAMREYQIEFADQSKSDDADDLSEAAVKRGVLESFLSYAMLDNEISDTDALQSKLQLMTMHAAKGLEFNTVFVCGLEDQIIPGTPSLFSQSQEDAKQAAREEEERRLLYVAITRAKRQLFLCYAQKRERYGKLNEHVASSLLDNISPDLLEKSSQAAQRSYGQPRAQAANNYARYDFRKKTSNFQDYLNNEVSMSVSDNDSQWPRGQVVIHKTFGKGKVLQTRGSGVHLSIQVSFPTRNSVWLLQKIANLEKLEENTQ